MHLAYNVLCPSMHLVSLLLVVGVLAHAVVLAPVVAGVACGEVPANAQASPRPLRPQLPPQGTCLSIPAAKTRLHSEQDGASPTMPLVVDSSFTSFIVLYRFTFI